MRKLLSRWRTLESVSHSPKDRRVPAPPAPAVLWWSLSGSRWRSCRRKSAGYVVLGRENEKQIIIQGAARR